MKIEERTEGAAVVVFPTGRLDGVGGPVLETRVSEIVERGAHRVVLDGSGIVYVSSAGLRALLVSARTCQKGGGELVVAALKPECRSVVNASGLLSVLAYRDTVQEALASPDAAGPGDRHVDAEPEHGSAVAIEELRDGPGMVLSLNGALNGTTAPMLEARVAAVIGRGERGLVLDCSRMSYINSTGLRALLLCARTCREERARLVIAALSPQCRWVMEMSGFLSIIEYGETRKQALAMLARTSG